MSRAHGRDVSVAISSFFVKCVGFWFAKNRCEQRFRNIMLMYTVFTISFSVWVQIQDFYYSWGDFSSRTYVACNILCLSISLFKLFILCVHKKGFLTLVLYMQNNFWNSHYTAYEETIFINWKRLCAYFICSFTLFTEISNISYSVRPILANIGKNESDRILPFNIYLNLPLSMTPYFEITFVVQILALSHVGVCYICFDNFLCMMNLHVAAQFRILQYRFENIHRLKFNKGVPVERLATSLEYSSDECYNTFKECIQQHQTLISFCKKLEEVFRTIVLAQVLTFSLLICFVGYQVVQEDLSMGRRFTFINLLLSNMCHLFMFTYSCDCLIKESTNIAAAVYMGPWTNLPMNKYGKMLRMDLQLTIMRSRQPCCLTANGFFPVSLETYTSTRDISVRMSVFFMKLVGIWSVDDPKDKMWRHLALLYSTSCVAYAIVTQYMGLYFSYGNTDEFLYILGTALTVALVLCKVCLLFMHRKGFFWLFHYMEKNFWHKNYDSYEKSILTECNRTCSFFIIFFVLFIQGTVICFGAQAIVENSGKNDSDRVLPFAIWVDVKWLAVTPYYELVYFSQILSLYHIGLTYFCCDNFLCIMSLHIAGQFRILQYRLQNLCGLNALKMKDKTSDKALLYYAEQCHEAFKQCVRDHQALIIYCYKLETVFTEMALGQVLTFSALMCLQGYQLIQSGARIMRRLIYICFFTASMTQLLMFTYSCDQIIEESTNVGSASYTGPWTHLPMNKYSKMLRNNMLMIMLRSKVPCSLTACRFFPVCLETYTTVLSTAMSYFTLLRQNALV